MRHFLAVLLLLLLPVQFAFAAAAPYCAFEKVQAASHFGHHDHPDAPAPESIDDDGEGGERLHDCGVCHLGYGQVHPALASIPAFPPVTSLRPVPDEREPEHLQEPSERPPRISLA